MARDQKEKKKSLKRERKKERASVKEKDIHSYSRIARNGQR